MSPPPFNPTVVAPTYNNARTLTDVIAEVAAHGLPVFVVNDGSTDDTAKLLSEYADAPAGSSTDLPLSGTAGRGRGRGAAVPLGVGSPNPLSPALPRDHAGEGERVSTAPVTVLTHPRNRGKAAALRTGFAAAAEAGYTHVLTIDTDGQHDPAEIPKLLDRAARQPEALILGQRDESAPGYPGKSRLGRRVSNLFIRMESGLRVDDSQCGMRVYPLGLVRAVRAGAGRYGFETEIVTRAGWAGCPVVEVPVACRYLPEGERVSHLNPLLDTFRHIGMHARLLARALVPWPPYPRWPAREAVKAPDGPKRSIHRRLIDWLNPREAWRQARRDRVSREAFAAGLAIGAFIGNLPAYGVHAFLGLYAARRLHLHPVAVVIGSHISTPPVGPLLNAAAIALGHLILRGSLPSRDSYDFANATFLQVLRRMLLEWVVGSPIVGFFCAVGVFIVSNRLLRLAASKDPVTADAAATGQVAPGSSATPANPDTGGSEATRPAGPAPGHAA